MAICQLVAQVAQALCEGKWTSTLQQQKAETRRLKDIFLNVVRDADQTLLVDPDYLAHFGWTRGTCSAGELWRYLAEQYPPAEVPLAESLQAVLEEGPLARRIVSALRGNFAARLQPVYRELCDCLNDGRSFRPANLVG